MSQRVRASTHRAAEAEMMAKSLQQENDILRCQLNDLISREKNQRLELQRLRAHRDVEVSVLVNATTQKLKGKIERLKAMLEPAASSLAQAVSEKDKALSDREQLVAEIQTMRKTIDDEGTTLRGLRVVLGDFDLGRLRSVRLEQRHVRVGARWWRGGHHHHGDSERGDFLVRFHVGDHELGSGVCSLVVDLVLVRRGIGPRVDGLDGEDAEHEDEELGDVGQEDEHHVPLADAEAVPQP